ncbi:lipopolysaccharide heptosyltransferase II [Eionea flava]
MHISPQAPKKILIIGPSWVGDMVMAQSLFIALKQQQPEAIIDVLAPSWSRPIIERMPQVRQAIAMPLGHGLFKIKERRTLGIALRKENYTQAIVLPNSWKSALIPWFANIPLRTGWRGEWRYGLLNDCRILDKKALPLMVQRFVALAFPATGKPPTQQCCPPPLLEASHDRLPTLLQKLCLQNHKPVLALCPGAEFGSAKQWPAKHYATTAQKMIAKGYQIWIMGSPSDQTVADAIYEQLTENEQHRTERLCGKTSLEDAIDLLSIADRVVSNDSGLMHIASALNKPLAALYGATSPAFTPPLSTTANVLSIPVDCGPCFKRECPEKHHRCLEELHPEQVIRAIQD